MAGGGLGECCKYSCARVLGAIPIVRASVEDTSAEAINRLCMDTFAVTGGVSFMFFDFFSMSEMDDQEVRLGKMYATMIAGMGTGMLGYNFIKGLCSCVYLGCSDSEVYDSTRQHLINDDHDPSINDGSFVGGVV